MPLVEAAGCLFYHSRPNNVAQLPPRGLVVDTTLAEDDSCYALRSTPRTRTSRGAGNRAKSVKGRVAKGSDEGGGRGRTGRETPAMTRRATNCVHTLNGLGEGGRLEAGLSRADVTYTKTTLRLRRGRDALATEI